MPDDPRAQAAPAGAAPDTHDQHYLRSLGRLGDARHVIVAQPIYSSTGVKLLDAGATVSSRTLERLVDHKLAQPLDQAIESDATLRSDALVAQARELAGANALVNRLVEALPQRDALWLHFAGAPACWVNRQQRWRSDYRDFRSSLRHRQAAYNK